MLFVNSGDGNKLYICADDGVDGEWQPLVGSWAQQNPGGAPTVAMTNDDQGDPIYVGIGTTNPTGRLTVVGEGNTNSTFSLNIINSSATNIFSVRDDGKVGIGTTIPNEQLEITGNLRLPKTTATTGIVFTGAERFLFNFGSFNTFLGERSGNLSMTGAYNTAIGWGALALNSDGYNNTTLGVNSLGNNTTGSFNTAVGVQALYYNSTGSNNAALGENTLADNTTGSGNTALGWAALNRNKTGDSNTAVGTTTLFYNKGSGNTAVGASALLNTNTGSSNTAVGNQTLNNNKTGQNNVAIGDASGNSNISGSGNVFLGHQAGYSEVDSDKLYIDNSNTATPLIYGDFSTDTVQINGILRLPTTTATSGIIYAGAYPFIHSFGSTNNTFLGVQAGNLTMTGTGLNTAIGNYALTSNTTGYGNTAVGTETFRYNTTGYSNTAVGTSALTSNTTGVTNTAVGYSALLLNTTANNNTAVGGYSLRGNTTGYSNTAVGYLALTNNSTGEGNDAFGLSALGTNTTGFGNSAFGDSSLHANSTGNGNVAVGSAALYTTTGNSNVAVGYQAGNKNTGSGNVFLGYQAGFSELGSNMLYIDNSQTSSPLIYGDFAADTIKINGSLSITSVPAIAGSFMKWNSGSFQVGKDIAEFFPSGSGHLGEGTLAALSADGSVIVAREGTQTLGPTPYLPGIVMDGSGQKIGPTMEEMKVDGKSPVALLGRVAVVIEGPVKVGDILVAGPNGRAVRWKPGSSVLSYVGLVVEVAPSGETATVLVGHQGLQKVLDSVQSENKNLREDLNELRGEVERLKNSNEPGRQDEFKSVK